MKIPKCSKSKVNEIYLQNGSRIVEECWKIVYLNTDIF